jgi:GntR family transcriptional regulator
MSKRRKKSRRRPLYKEVAEALESILQEMETGSYLPSEPVLAEQLGVSRATLREAMRTFEGRGWIVRRQGVGTYVTRPPQVIPTGLEVLESIETRAARLDMNVSMGGHWVEQRQPTDQESEQFEISADDEVLEVSRVILTDKRPVAYLIDILPRDILDQHELVENFQGSVLDRLLKRGTPTLSHSQAEISAIAAPGSVARQLNIQRGDVLQLFEAWLFAQDGRVIDHSFSYFLPGIFRFNLVRRVEQ